MFSDDLSPVHIYCKDLIMQAHGTWRKRFCSCLHRCRQGKVGRITCKDMHVTPWFLLKRRDAKGTEVSSINADVKGG
jgi:hypothetical protein